MADLERRRSTSRYKKACLSVIDHQGGEVLRVGGLWDSRLRRYAGPCEPHVVQLTEAQSEKGNDLGRAFAELIAATQRNDPRRARVLMAGGNRGSGKTHFLGGVGLTVVALAWPGEVQICVNANSENRTEVIAQIAKVVPPEWIHAQSNDLRDPWLEFITGSRIKFVSAQNPKRLRVGGLPVRHIFLNEAQAMAALNYESACGTAFRNSGFVSLATNPPRTDSTDWVAHVWNGIEAGEAQHRGLIFRLKNKLNQKIDQDAVDDLGVMLRLSSQEAADADADGAMKLSGPIAYKNFKALPLDKGGHIGDPPPIPMLGSRFWRDVTRERTAAAMFGGNGYDWIIGSDFQRRPGIVGVACKLFEVEQEWEILPLPKGTLVIWAGDQINCPGDESSYSDTLDRKGYAPTDGLGKPSAILVGDGTGAKQNAAHRWELPVSFVTLKTEGWNIVPPRWTKRRKADNPTVKESRSQMYDLFDARQVLISPRLKQGEEGFYSLVSCLQRAKVNTNGSLVGGNHHAPDGLRYVCWWAGPTPTPPSTPGLDDQSFNALRAVRLLQSG